MTDDTSAIASCWISQCGCTRSRDIGANFGLYAASVALQTDYSTIIAYEPAKRSYDRLRANLLINDLTERVANRMVAVSSSTGSVPFSLGPDNNDFAAKVCASSSNGYAVPAVRLEDESSLA